MIVDELLDLLIGGRVHVIEEGGDHVVGRGPCLIGKGEDGAHEVVAVFVVGFVEIEDLAAIGVLLVGIGGLVGDFLLRGFPEFLDGFVFKRGLTDGEVVGLHGQRSRIGLVREEIVELKARGQFVLVFLVEEGEGRSLGNDLLGRGGIELRNLVPGNGIAVSGHPWGTGRGGDDRKAFAFREEVGRIIMILSGHAEVVLRGQKPFVVPFGELDGEVLGLLIVNELKRVHGILVVGDEGDALGFEEGDEHVRGILIDDGDGLEIAVFLLTREDFRIICLHGLGQIHKAFEGIDVSVGFLGGSGNGGHVFARIGPGGFPSARFHDLGVKHEGFGRFGIWKRIVFVAVLVDFAIEVAFVVIAIGLECLGMGGDIGDRAILGPTIDIGAVGRDHIGDVTRRDAFGNLLGNAIIIVLLGAFEDEFDLDLRVGLHEFVGDAFCIIIKSVVLIVGIIVRGRIFLVGVPPGDGTFPILVQFNVFVSTAAGSQRGDHEEGQSAYCGFKSFHFGFLPFLKLSNCSTFRNKGITLLFLFVAKRSNREETRLLHIAILPRFRRLSIMKA